MFLSRIVIWVSSMGMAILGTNIVSAQNYPNKPIRILASGPGGITDFAARLLAQGLAGGLGQQVIVDNRPSGVIPMDIVAKSPPDGYTLLVTGGSLWTTPLLQDNVPYDAVRDFAPISLTNTAPNLLVVHPSLPVKSVKELIALAKARPGALNYSSAGAGSSSHLSAALFTHMAGVNIARIPFKSGSSRMASLVGGEVQIEFATAGSVSTYVKTGRLRLLAVTSAQASALFPGIPPVAETVPGYESAQMGGIFAPAKTPPEIVNRLNQEIVRFLKTPDARDRFLNAGVEAVGSSPEQMANAMKSEVTRLTRVIRDAGIRAE